ncbi:MAG: hypothetical protein VX100_12030 [Pseudomonadota bacterium]|nr:hypothetical protein [Pseudomonadota bacterium]
MLIDNEFTIREGLLLHKNISPLSEQHLDELKHVQNLDVTGFTEADVRGEIIDPIIRVLGYKKGQFSSVDREKHIRFLGKTHKYIDYNFTLWRENFWIIEAKKPLKGDRFGYDELSQATEYSIHPEINASVIVLCDGLKLEIFDREEDLETPVISFKIKNLLENIDSLRKILEPMQIWFFYKRRVLKSIDKAFESEFNQQRVNEFLDIIENRFREKRGQILKNFQSAEFTKKDSAVEVSNASIDDIIDVYFFFSQPIPTMHSMNKVLIDHCLKMRSFDVIYKVFPDHYRDANDAYYSNALSFLIQLEMETNTLNWSPSWLVGEGDKTVESTIKGLISHTLNFFENDEARKIILLASSAFRRLFKVLSIVSPQLNQGSELQHLLTRVNESEFSWNQILSSPKRNIIIDIDRLSLLATDRFVSDFTSDKYKFNSALAKQQLSQVWHLEKMLLESTPNYRQLLREKDLGELHPTEASSVVFDNLGHNCLCVIKMSEKWEKYTLENHMDEVIALSKTGSWAAKEMLEGKEIPDNSSGQTIKLSDRFFLGNDKLQGSLKTLYGYS